MKKLNKNDIFIDFNNGGEFEIACESIHRTYLLGLNVTAVNVDKVNNVLLCVVCNGDFRELLQNAIKALANDYRYGKITYFVIVKRLSWLAVQAIHMYEPKTKAIAPFIFSICIGLCIYLYDDVQEYTSYDYSPLREEIKKNGAGYYDTTIPAAEMKYLPLYIDKYCLQVASVNNTFLSIDNVIMKQVTLYASL